MRLRVNFYLPIFLLLIVVVLSSGLSFSRYTSTICNTGDESTVIIVNKYNLMAELVTDPQNLDLQHPGIKDQTYDFTLINKYPDDSDNADITTGPLSYTITVTMDWSQDNPVTGLKVPLDMSLYRLDSDGNEIDITEPPPAGTSVNYISTVEDVIGSGDSINFCLKWDWPEQDNDYRYANKKIDVKIVVRAEQAVEGD
jgi:hypothetical protein